MTKKFISVKEFIGITDILSATHYEDEIERDIALLEFMTGRPEEVFLNMTLKQLKAEREALFIPDINTPPKPQRFIKANGKTYAPVFDFSKLTASQYIDSTSFMKDPERIVENLPEIMASICLPTKWTITGRKILPYMSIPHKEVAADMDRADIMDAYAIAVFFWTVLRDSLQTTAGFLVRELIAAKTKAGITLTNQETKALLSIIATYGDGTTPPDLSQTSNV